MEVGIGPISGFKPYVLTTSPAVLRVSSGVVYLRTLDGMHVQRTSVAETSFDFFGSLATGSYYYYIIVKRDPGGLPIVITSLAPAESNTGTEAEISRLLVEVDGSDVKITFHLPTHHIHILTQCSGGRLFAVRAGGQ